MNNDLINNHSSMSSNIPIANQSNPQMDRFIQESYIRNKNKGVLDIQSKGNRTIFFDSDNEKRPSSQKELLISKTVSKYPTNYAAGPNPYNDGIVQGYFVNNRGEPKYNHKTYQEPIREIEFERNEGNPGMNYYRDNIEVGGDEIGYQNEGENEEDIEMQNANQYDDYSPQKAVGEYNEYIGDGIVRNIIPNYSPNQNVPYYKKKNLNNYNMYNNYNRDYVQMNENEDDQYDMESPIKNYNYNREPYKRRHILGNLGDSASSEAYANNNNQIQKPSIIDSSQRVYVKPRSRTNNLNLHGISTEERGIESRIESTNNANSNMRTFLKRPYHYIDSEENELVRNKFNKHINYDEDSLNVVEPPSHNYSRDKGGKVDLNLILKNRGRKPNREEGERENEEEKEEERDEEREDEREREIEEERDEEREGEGEEGEQEQVQEKEEEEDNVNNQEAKEAEELKELFVTKIQAFWRGRSTRRIMTLYHDLDEFIYLLSKVHFNHFSDNFYFFINQLFNEYKSKIDNNQNESLEEENENDDNIDNENENNEFNEKENEPDENENNKNYDELLNDYNELKNKYNELLQNNKDYKTSTKKTQNNNDIMSVPGETTFGTIKTENKKFKKRPQNNELTFSNDYYNDDIEGNKHYYTPFQEDDDSFNEGSKEKRFSYSSIHSEENSKYFDNEQPAKRSTTGKRSITLNNRGNKNAKIGLLSLNKKKDSKLSYSPSSRGNSSKRNNNDGNQNENTINISIIQKPKENKNNYFDSNFMYPENENNLELIAKKKSDEQKINDILNNERLFEKMKNKIGNGIYPKKTELVQNYGESFMIKSKKPFEKILDNNIISKNNDQVQNNEIETNINNLEIIQNEHKNFVPSKLDLEFNEIFIGQDKSLLNKKRLEQIIPTNENEFFFEKDNKALFPNDKTLPSFNNKENNAFTINNNYPKSEPKGSGFKPDNISIENISNSEFTINEPAKTERESKRPKEMGKEIIILPSKGNKFVRLRRSKRTKETYFSIKPNKNNIYKPNDNKIILSKINENNFEIKSEYYYVETDDNPLPEIIEKKIIINEPSPNVNKFNNEKTIFTHENDININEEKEKKEYLEDIETNELTILSNRKSKKGKKENKNINKIEEFTIKGEKKKWNELEFIPNEDFIIIKDYYKESEQSSNMGKEDEKNNDVSFDIETNQLEIIDRKKKKNKNKEDKKEEIIYKNEFRNIEPTQENELYIMKTRKIRHRKNVSVPMKENNINLNGFDILKVDKEVQIDPIREVKITTKKILKHEKVLSRKKFLNNKKTTENSLSFDGIKNYDSNKYRNNFDIKNLIKDSNVEVFYKNSEKNIKENKTEMSKQFDTLVPTANDKFNINKKKKRTKEEETEMDEDFISNEQSKNKENKDNLKSINNENISIKGKRRKKMVEESTEMDKDEFKFNINDNNKNNTIIKGDNLDIVAPKKEIILEKYNLDDINLESRIRAFPRLDMNKCLDQEFIGKENEIKNKELEYTQNEQITFEPKKNVKNEEPSKEKEQKYYIENNQIFIPQKKNKSKKEDKDENQKRFDDLCVNKIEEQNLIGKETANKKKKKKMKESETQIDNDLINYVKENNEEFEYLKTVPLKSDESSKIKENKLFNDLEIYKGEPHEFKEKEKEKISLENIKNESIMFEPHKKDIKYYIDSNQFLIKTKKKKNENENKIKSGFDELTISKSDAQNIYIKRKKKKKKRTKDSETQIDDDLKINENTEEENDSNKLRGQRKEKKEEKIKYLIDSNNQLNIKGHKKKKVPLKEEKKEDINYSPIKTNKLFSTLEISKCEEKTISGKDKEPTILENVKNDSIEIKSKKNKKIDMETQIEKNDLKLDLVPENNDIFSLKSKKPNNIIVKNKRFIIKDDQPQKLNGFDNLEQAFSENIEIKTQKEFDESEPLPKKVFDIANLSQLKEGSLEIQGKPEIKKEPEIDMGKINNMVNEKLEEEKHKNLDNTKNKLFKVLKAVKLKNALCKNTQNKKYFMDKLKEIKKNKDDKKILSYENAININYLSSKIEKFESCTDTDYLDEMLDDLKKKKITIEKNNAIEIIEEKDKIKEFIPLIEKKDQFSIKDKKKRFKENETEITEELNRMEIESIKSLKFSLINNKDMDEDEDEEDEKEESKKLRKVVHRKNISISNASMSESRENDLNISGISKDTADKEVQIEPMKEFKITTKKIVKKEMSTKRKFMNNKISNNSLCIISTIENKNKNKEKSESDVISNKKEKVETCDEMTQTPKLRPARDKAQKVVFHEIKTIIKKEQKPLNKYEIDHVNKLKFIGNGNNFRKKYKKRPLLKAPQESALNTGDNIDYDKEYRIEKLKNLLYLFVIKKIDTLKIIYFMKWIYLSKNEEITREDIKEIKNFFSKYHKIFTNKLLYFFDQYAKYYSLLETLNKIKNERNRKTFKLIKKHSQLNNKKENKLHIQPTLSKKKLAFEKIDSILKKNAGKYFFSLYKNT